MAGCSEGGDAATCAPSEADFSFCLFCSQRGKEEYKLAATSDGEAKKAKKGKGHKDMDDLKKEVDLVSRRTTVPPHLHENQDVLRLSKVVLMQLWWRQTSSLVT